MENSVKFFRLLGRKKTIISAAIVVIEAASKSQKHLSISVLVQVSPAHRIISESALQAIIHTLTHTTRSSALQVNTKWKYPL